MKNEKNEKNAQPKLSEQQLDEEVARYREAIRKGTLCERCLDANTPGSKFCKDCGRAL